MSLTLNTNVAALTAHQNMLSNDKSMNTSLERLSTGLRINRAADDASGMAIADSLKAQYLGIGQGIENANEAVSVVQTADGALEESINIVNTISTKAIQAASESQTSETRAAIQADIDKLLEELDSIAQDTTYNGQQLLSGSYTNKQVQVGDSANTTATINIGSTQSSQSGHISTASLKLDGETGGEIALTITSASTGEEVSLKSVEIAMNNKEENGMGALADEINSVSYLTGIRANAVVESTTETAIQEGSTGSDFSINGVTIGSVNVSGSDSKRALITAINDQSTKTGVSASINDDGTMTLSSNDGRAIYLSGDSGEVFGEQDAEDLSTVGYISLTQSGSSSFNIEGTTTTTTGDELKLTADFTSTSESTLAAESTIRDGSTLAAGTVLGGDTTIATNELDTLADYKLAEGSTLAAGSTLSQGTVLGGTIVVAGETTAGTGNQTTVKQQQDVTITAGSILAEGTTMTQGTVVQQTFTNNGITYNVGDALTADITLTTDLSLSSDMTLAEGSEIAAGSSLASGSEIGADTQIGYTYDDTTPTTTDLSGTTSGDHVLKAATTQAGTGDSLAAGSIMTDGSTITIGAAGTYNGPTLVTDKGTIEAGDTLAAATYTVVGDQTLDQELKIDGTTLTGFKAEAGSIVKDSSSLTTAVAAGDYQAVTLTSASITQGMTLEAGSSLSVGSQLASGSTIGSDIIVSGDVVTDEETELAGGSTLMTGSILAEGSTVDGTLTVDAVSELESAMTLEEGSVLRADTLLKAGTTINQDMELDIVDSTGTSNTVIVEAGTVLTQDLYLEKDTVLSEAMTLEKGSSIAAGSELIVAYEDTGDVALSDEENLTLADISVMTQEDAQIAIEIASAALEDLDATRSSLGSVQNQLESTISNLSVTRTNVQSAESTIRDVDFAEETANYTRLSLLAQTSSYALAQANASSQNVMSLLQ